MSEMSKAARAAMKKKAEKLTTADPSQKVDSSTWSPPEPLNADVKTGMRPVSRRAYKKGGKVEGEAAPMRADRQPRKAGGKSEMPLVDRFINKDLKKANEYREGVKHVGGMNKGGRTKKNFGGPLMQPGGMMSANPEMGGVAPDQSNMSMRDPREDMVGKSRFNFIGASGNPRLKNGGKAEKHDDAKQDMALIKKMVKLQPARLARKAAVCSLAPVIRARFPVSFPADAQLMLLAARPAKARPM